MFLPLENLHLNKTLGQSSPLKSKMKMTLRIGKYKTYSKQDHLKSCLSNSNIEHLVHSMLTYHLVD